MLSEYLRAAMAKAHYELLGGGEGFYGEIPGFQGSMPRERPWRLAARN
jgi:hypothetical protein